MPKSIPSVGDSNWGAPLNEHLAQMMDSTTGGINIWDDADARDTLYWADGEVNTNVNGQTVNTAEYEGKTGYNRNTGSFERWETTPQRRWITLQKAVAPSKYRGPGRLALIYDNANEYFYLQNDQTGTNTLERLVSIGNIIEVGPNNNSFDAFYLVEELVGVNKVRVARTNVKFEDAQPGVTYTPSSSDPQLSNVSVPDYFRTGDTFRGGFDNNGSVVIDGGGTIVGKLNPTTYVNSASTFHNSSRTVYLISRGPGTQANYSYNIFEPTIKYTSTDGKEVFTIDNFGSTRINALAAINDDTSILGDNPPLIARRVIRSNDSFGRQTDDIVLSSRYAIRSGENYTNHSGVGINAYREVGSDVVPSASSNVSDWNGSNGSNPAVLTLRGGFQTEDFGTLNNPTVVQDAWNGLMIRQSYKSGKIKNFKAIRIFVVAASGGNTTPMDELWGIYETGYTSGMVGGNVPSKNYFQGNMGIGNKSADPRSGSTNRIDLDTGNTRTTYDDIDEKLVVYGNAHLRKWDYGGTTGDGTLFADGRIETAGTVTSNGTVLTSDERLKTKIAALSGAQALETLQRLEAKSFEFKETPGHKHYGVLAQEIEQVLPELVGERRDGMKTVNYVELIPLLVESIKTQQQTIESLQSRLDALEN